MGNVFKFGDTGKFGLRYVDAHGKWKSARTPYTAAQRALAVRALHEIEARIAAGERVAPDRADGDVTVAEWGRAWIERRRLLVADVSNDEARLRLHVLPAIGDLAIARVRPRDLIALFSRLRTSKKLAPKSIWNVYSVTKALFRDARKEDLITDTPCILGGHELGPMVDKDPEWRPTAKFTRTEVGLLLTSEHVAVDRRVVYAIEALAGLRPGEVNALRWRNWDRDAEPLTKLIVARSNARERTKTHLTRSVPVHPALAAALAAWHASGWELSMGRKPGPDDLIAPMPPAHVARQRTLARADSMRNKNYSRKRIIEDFAALGFRHRRTYDLRRTFVSLAREDGARVDVLERITHNPSKRDAAIDLYTTFDWPVLCAEIAKLRVVLPGEPPPAPTPKRRTPNDDDSPGTAPHKANGPGSEGGTEAACYALATTAERLAVFSGDSVWRRRESKVGLRWWLTARHRARNADPPSISRRSRSPRESPGVLAAPRCSASVVETNGRHARPAPP